MAAIVEEVDYCWTSDEIGDYLMVVALHTELDLDTIVGDDCIAIVKLVELEFQQTA